jgi:hypothetical protein
VVQPAEDELFEAFANSTMEPVSELLHELPSDVNQYQIIAYYQLGSIYDFAVIQRPSTNVLIEGLPQSFSPKFVGVLYARNNDTSWHKLARLQIESNINDRQTNPYHLWLANGKLRVSIVDTNGAGSGEGHESVWEYVEREKWTKKACVYYQVWGDKTYLTSTANFGAQGKTDSSLCNTHRWISAE